jgi:hypothetical protein
MGKALEVALIVILALGVILLVCAVVFLLCEMEGRCAIRCYVNGFTDHDLVRGECWCIKHDDDSEVRRIE